MGKEQGICGSAPVSFLANCLDDRKAEPGGAALFKALAHFLPRRTVGLPQLPQLPQQVFGKRHPSQRRPRLQLPMQLGRQVPYLYRHRHAFSMRPWKPHVNFALLPRPGLWLWVRRS